MGQLVDGVWIPGDVATSNIKGAYIRTERTFRDSVSFDNPIFQPESGRYHLYVSLACPWAHRTLIYLHLKNLGEHVPVSIVHPEMLESGWSFSKEFSGSTGDCLYGLDYLYQLYLQADCKISSSVTVPVLWDSKTRTIVNNESSEIIRMFNTAFNDLTGERSNFYPVSLREEIDSWNNLIYKGVNNGVYKAGFAKSQQAYDEAIVKLFDVLDQIDLHLASKQFLVGDQLTEADFRLVPTLIRFDIVYHGHFKCNVCKISEYKNISRYLKEIFSLNAVKRTTNYEHITRHYHFSHDTINPYRLVPRGPRSLII
jgi:putative glutathione S-transferase